MSSYKNLDGQFTVESDSCKYTDDAIIADYSYETTIVDGNTVKPSALKMQFKTERKVGKTGVMLVGLGGNNGCTCVAGAIANKLGLTWETKEGTQKSNYWGSLLLASTVKLGNDRQWNSAWLHRTGSCLRKMSTLISRSEVTSNFLVGSCGRKEVLQSSAYGEGILAKKIFSHI